MSGMPNPHTTAEPWERKTLYGWENYHRAIDLLEHDEWRAALRLLAAADDEVRTCAGQAGLWRARSGQAAAHRGVGDPPLGRARATAGPRARAWDRTSPTRA